MEISTDNSNLARISAQVGCTSFAVAMFGATSAMATVALPEDTMTYGNIDLTANGERDVFFDITGDDYYDFEIKSNAQLGEIYGRGFKTGPFHQFSQVADRLFSAGETVDGTANFEPGQYIYAEEDLDFPLPTLGLEPGQTAYLGLRIEYDSIFNYGWVEVTRGSITAGSFGYQNMAGMGAPITAPVPLPASLPLLALGAGGLAALRRKRKAS